MGCSTMHRLTFFALLLTVGSAHAQVVPDPRLHQVSFDGPGIHTVVKDDFSAVYSKAWVDANLDGDADDFALGDDRAPICYSIGADVHISTVFVRSVQTNWFNTQHGTIVGTSGGTTFTSTSVIALPDNGEWLIIAPGFTGSIPSPSTIDWWEKHPISWSLEVDDPATPGPPDVYTLGTSKHDIHFIGDNGDLPILYYTYIDIGCRRAKGVGSFHIRELRIHRNCDLW